MGGSNLLLLYNSSLTELFSSVYPEFEWVPWNFRQTDNKNFFGDEKNRREFMDWAGKELGVKELTGWYKISNKVKKY